MFKSLVALALAVAISGCAAQQAAPSVQASQASQAPEAQVQTRRVCETIEDDATGTKIARRQECHDVVDEEAKQPKAN